MACGETGSAAAGVLSKVFSVAPGPGIKRRTDCGCALKLTDTITETLSGPLRSQLTTLGFSGSSIVSEPSAKAGLVFLSRMRFWYQSKSESGFFSSALTLTVVESGGMGSQGLTEAV